MARFTVQDLQTGGQLSPSARPVSTYTKFFPVRPGRLEVADLAPLSKLATQFVQKQHQARLKDAEEGGLAASADQEVMGALAEVLEGFDTMEGSPEEKQAALVRAWQSIPDHIRPPDAAFPPFQMAAEAGHGRQRASHVAQRLVAHLTTGTFLASVDDKGSVLSGAGVDEVISKTIKEMTSDDVVLSASPEAKAAFDIEMVRVEQRIREAAAQQQGAQFTELREQQAGQELTRGFLVPADTHLIQVPPDADDDDAGPLDPDQEAFYGGFSKWAVDYRNSGGTNVERIAYDSVVTQATKLDAAGHTEQAIHLVRLASRAPVPVGKDMVPLGDVVAGGIGGKLAEYIDNLEEKRETDQLSSRLRREDSEKILLDSVSDVLRSVDLKGVSDVPNALWQALEEVKQEQWWQDDVENLFGEDGIPGDVGFAIQAELQEFIRVRSDSKARGAENPTTLHELSRQQQVVDPETWRTLVTEAERRMEITPQTADNLLASADTMQTAERIQKEYPDLVSRTFTSAYAGDLVGDGTVSDEIMAPFRQEKAAGENPRTRLVEMLKALETADPEEGIRQVVAALGSQSPATTDLFRRNQEAAQPIVDAVTEIEGFIAGGKLGAATEGLDSLKRKIHPEKALELRRLIARAKNTMPVQAGFMPQVGEQVAAATGLLSFEYSQRGLELPQSTAADINNAFRTIAMRVWSDLTLDPSVEGSVAGAFAVEYPKAANEWMEKNHQISVTSDKTVSQQNQQMVTRVFFNDPTQRVGTDSVLTELMGVTDQADVSRWERYRNQEITKVGAFSGAAASAFRRHSRSPEGFADYFARQVSVTEVNAEDLLQDQAVFEFKFSEDILREMDVLADGEQLDDLAAKRRAIKALNAVGVSTRFQQVTRKVAQPSTPFSPPGRVVMADVDTRTLEGTYTLDLNSVTNFGTSLLQVNLPDRELTDQEKAKILEYTGYAPEDWNLFMSNQTKVHERNRLKD